MIPIGFDQWNIPSKTYHNKLTLKDLPGLRGDALAPDHMNLYPYVLVRFLDPEANGDRYLSWDHFARWYWNVFNKAALNQPPVANPLSPSVEQLRELAKPFHEQITYRQIYLSNSRGYVPLAGEEVLRRAYGDCKDMVSCLAQTGADRNIRVHPVLCSIVNGPFLTEKDVPQPFFNHLIGAIPLKHSLNLPAEVVAGSQRFLLFDPTSRHTPIGMLPDSHRGRQVMICTPQGASWVKIPDASLEKGSVTIRLEGRLNESFDLFGTLSIEEQRNALGLYGIMADSNPRMLKNAVQALFDLPGTVELSLEDTTQNAPHAVSQWTLRWPAFLRMDADGWRLPESMIPLQETRLQTHRRRRVAPIALPGSPRITWVLDLETSQTLRPGLKKAQWQGPWRSWLWEINKGNGLRINYTLENRETIYPKSNISEGLKEWRDFRTRYDDFRTLGTLLRLQKP